MVAGWYSYSIHALPDSTGLAGGEKAPFLLTAVVASVHLAYVVLETCLCTSPQDAEKLAYQKKRITKTRKYERLKRSEMLA